MSNNTTSIDWAQIPVHLQLNTSAPDPIGFAKVSGFYGPGAWAGWFLTLCASWYSLLLHDIYDQGFDPSTWIYLLGMNWASFDLLRHLSTLNSLMQNGDDAWVQEAASVGAALSVVIWGMVHALAQLPLCFRPIYDGMPWDETQRGLTLIFGTIFPATALAASVWMIDGFGDELVVSPHIPALYFDGMPNRMKTKHIGKSSYNGGHDLAMIVPGMTGIWALVFYTWLLGRYFQDSRAASVAERALEIACSPLALLSPCIIWLVERIQPWHIWFAVGGGYIVSVILLAVNHARAFWYFTPLYPTLAFFMFFLSPLGFLMYFLQISVAYIFSAYFHLVTSPSQSCFFMPCAPQSIKEIDQTFSLLAGLFSFVVVEVIVPRARKYRKERREQRIFEQGTQRAFNVRSGQITEQHPTSIATYGTVNVGDAGSNDIPLPNRVNSGIRAEEGQAGPWQVTRVNSGRAGHAGRTTTW